MGVRLSTDEQRAFLERGHTGILTTLRRDGWPVSLPVWYVVLDGTVWLGTPPTAKKVTRLRNDDRCSFLVESGQRWVDLAAVEFRARAVLVEAGPRTEAVAAELARKYEDFSMPRDKLPTATQDHYAARTYIRLEPTGPAISWNNQKIRLAR